MSNEESTLLRLLSDCDWKDSHALIQAHETLEKSNEGESTWKALCELLQKDFIHLPTKVSNYRDLFFELWDVKRRWAGHRVGPSSFRISVAARFCPLRENGSDDSANKSATGVVPLHQKLQLIQAKHNCDAQEARKILWSKTNTNNDPWQDATLPDQDGMQSSSNLTSEQSHGSEDKADPEVQGMQACVLAVQPNQVVMFAPGSGLRPFELETVFNHHDSQQRVYESTAARIVGDLINGHNLSIICYGQTGSGKTFTMFGPNESSSTTIKELSPQAGLVPRVCHDLMKLISERGKAVDGRAGIHSDLEMSYVEVYGNEVADLLRDGRAIGAWHGLAVRSVLEGGAQVPVASVEDLEHLLVKGERCKRRAATSMNLRSSRAHSLLFLTLSQTHPVSGVVLRSQICLADLGGSEQVKKSGVTGVRMAEAIQINSALLALKKCILALQASSKPSQPHRVKRTEKSNEEDVDGDQDAEKEEEEEVKNVQHSGEGDEASETSGEGERDLLPHHIPYQDSQLTQLLSPALSGQAKTLVMVTASMDQIHAMETLQTLRFAETCRAVIHSSKHVGPAIMTVNVQEMMKSLDHEIAECEAEILSKEKWETQKRERNDVDAITGEIHMEVVTVSVMVGAELEHARLEQLLARKRALLAI